MVELLVSLAVFATVMAGISVVFISSLRAWRTGRENRSVFQMARAASQFMERDITAAFGSVDRDEVKTLVGEGRWLTFVGITENPPTWRQFTPGEGIEMPHSDMSRITYMLIEDPEMGDQFLLIRLVQIDSDIIPPGPIRPGRVIEQTRTAWETIILDADPAAEPGPDGRYVQPDDFELASNILDMEFRYGVLKGNVELEQIWLDWRDVLDEPTYTDEERRILLGNLWNETIAWSSGWDSRNRADRKLPDIIEIRLTVRAAAKMPGPETVVRGFRRTIFLPLGYRRPRPLALQ
jgi:hypothetical protein